MTITATVQQPATATRGGRLGRSASTALLIGVPVAWGIVLLFHPTGDGDEFYPILRDQVGPWLAVHLATTLLLPLMALVVLVLLQGIDGPAARVSRTALPIFAVAYTAWEVLIGVGTGLLVDEVNGLSTAERATGAQLVEQFTGHGVVRALEYIGSAAWMTAVVAATIALRGALAPSRLALALLVVSAPLVAIHVPPFGPVGLALFVIAVLTIRSSGRLTTSEAA